MIRNQERDQELALSRGLQLAFRDEQHEALYGSDEALARQVPLAVLLLAQAHLHRPHEAISRGQQLDNLAQPIG